MTAAEAIPYNLLNDNAIMSLFVLNLVGMAYVFLMNGSSIVERAKSMFYHGKQSNPYNDRTHITKLCNLLLYLQTTFYCSIIAFGGIQYTTAFARGTTPHILLAALCLLVAAALLVKRVLYHICNITLFSAAAAREWNESYFFTIKLTGFILLPLAICVIFVKGFSITYYTIPDGLSRNDHDAGFTEAVRRTDTVFLVQYPADAGAGSQTRFSAAE